MNNKDEIYKSVNQDIFNISKEVVNQFKNQHSVWMNLAGGALRDLILDNEDKIKDIDLVLSFEDICKRRIVKDKKTKLYIEDLINIYNENINKLGEAFERSGYEVKRYQNFPKEVVQELNPTENDEIYNKLENFLGVLKIKGNNLSYEIDILFVLDIESYVNNFFDFNICKVQSEIIRNGFMQENAENLVQNGLEKFKVKNRHFLEDAKNKTITYNLSNKTEEDLLNSFQKHLPRIYDKYKEYKIEFDFEKKDLKTPPVSGMEQKDWDRLKKLTISLKEMFYLELELKKKETSVKQKIRKT